MWKQLSKTEEGLAVIRQGCPLCLLPNHVRPDTKELCGPGLHKRCSLRSLEGFLGRLRGKAAGPSLHWRMPSPPGPYSRLPNILWLTRFEDPLYRWCLEESGGKSTWPARLGRSGTPTGGVWTGLVFCKPCRPAAWSEIWLPMHIVGVRKKRLYWCSESRSYLVRIDFP